MHFHPSETVYKIVEFAIQILTTAKVSSYNLAVKFEGKEVDKWSTAHRYVGRTSRMCPLVLCWGKPSLYYFALCLYDHYTCTSYYIHSQFIFIEDSFFVCHWANGLKSLTDVNMKSGQNVSALVQKALPRLTSGGVSESDVMVKLEGKEIDKSTKMVHFLNATSESLPLELSWGKRTQWFKTMTWGQGIIVRLYFFKWF